MNILDLVRRLLTARALLMIGAIAVSLLTRDAWLRVGHVLGIVSAVIAAFAVMMLIVAGLRWIASRRTSMARPCADLAAHERGACWA